MSVRDDARRNLELAGMFDKDSDYEGLIGHAVMKLVDAHCDEHHSGMSSELAIGIFNIVIKGNALTAKYWDEKADELKELAKKQEMAFNTPQMESDWLEGCLGPRPTVGLP